MHIDYHVVPTFARVHKDTNPFIFIRGPVGPLSCDTEVLTKSGWTRIDEWVNGTEIAQISPLDMNMSYVDPGDVIVSDCTEFISFKNKHSLSMLLSEEHTVLAYDYKGDIKITTAAALEEKPSKHTIPNTFNIDPEGAVDENYLRLRTAIAADGHYPKAGNQCTVTLRKERKIARLKSLLEANGIKWTEYNNVNRPTEVRFTFDRPEFSKHFGDEIYLMNSAQLRVIADECSKWDGTESSGEFRFVTSLKDQADKIQFACHASGYKANIKEITYSKPNWKSTYVVYIAKSSPKCKVSVRRDSTEITRVPSQDGKKYCFTTETGFMLARHNGCIFITGNSGKSTGCIFHCFLNACEQLPDMYGVRRSRYAVVRSTYPALKSTTLKSWISWFKDKIKITYDIPIRAEIKYGLGDGTSIHMEVLFIGVDSDQQIEKLRSLEVTGVHMNEAGELDEGIFQMMKTRFNRYPASKDGGAIKPFIMLDYNSVSTDHWLYKLAEEIRPEGHSFYSQPPAVFLVDGRYVVNPLADNLTRYDEFGNKICGVEASYYETMCLGSDPDFIYVNVMNNYGEVRKGKPVFKDYNDNDHCASHDLLPSFGSQLVIGMDQGLTPAAAICQQLPDGKILVLDEIVTTDCSLQEFCNDIIWPLMKTKYSAFEKNFYVVCDPATAQRSMNDSKAGTDIIKESGLPYRTAKTNVFTARKEAVVYFLRMKDKFSLSPACKALRKGFLSEYKYEEVRSSQTDLFKEKPAKNEFSHVHDALQYAMLEFYHLKEKKRPKVHRKKYKSGSDIGGY